MNKQSDSALRSWLGAVAAFTVAASGCGNVANLGDGQGGQGPSAGSSNTGGTFGEAGGGTGSGGMITPFGGRGGEPGNATGGNAGTTALTYPLNPTVPIEAECACPDPNSVCNAKSVCVPRCEGDVCAIWRVERAVTSLMSDGEDLYLLLSGERDALGNPVLGMAGKSALLKARYPDQQPSEIARFDGPQWPGPLLGRVAGRTYLRDDSPPSQIFAIGDDGSVAVRALPSQTFAVGVGADGLYVRTIDGLYRGPLDLSSDPELLISVPADGQFASTLLVGDRIWFSRGAGVCSIQPELPEDESCLAPAGVPFAALGTDLFSLVGGLVGEVHRQSLSGQDRTLYRPGPGPNSGLSRTPLLYANTLYSLGLLGAPDSFDLLYFAADNATEPAIAVSSAVTRALQEHAVVPGISGELDPAVPHETDYDSAPLFSVNATGVFLMQQFNDVRSNDANISRYVFRAPVP